MMNNYQPYFDLGKLIAKHLQNELTEQEQKELNNWLGLSIRNQEIFNRITDKDSLDKELEIFSASERERAWANIAEATGVKKTTSRFDKMRRVLSYAAVLLLLLTIGITSRHFIYRKSAINTLVMHKQDILPGTNKATLILADGSKISLDDAKRGKIASQENVDIDKTQNGQLVYNPSGPVETAGKPDADHIIPTNTIVTPRGGQYAVVLPDGTKVWINAASSLKYPTEFAGTERRVELTGEAYFEVAKNAAKPFFVKSAGQTVEVLGTHFNINSYTDEKSIKTTLLEGSVKVTGNNGSQMVKLKPGQQAVGTGKDLKVIADADIDEAIAWKNGKFIFRDTELKTIMRQLSRWYDVDVEYRNEITERHYRGKVSRDVPVSQVFEILKTSGINFTIIGRKIIVKS